jgi:hypothetical protein
MSAFYVVIVVLGLIGLAFVVVLRIKNPSYLKIRAYGFQFEVGRGQSEVESSYSTPCTNGTNPENR